MNESERLREVLRKISQRCAEHVDYVDDELLEVIGDVWKLAREAID